MNQESKRRTIGYARVAAADDRSLDRQAQALGEVDLLFAETAAGTATAARPELERLLGQLREGDVVRTFSADRLARSPRALLDVVERIEASGARLEIVDMPDADLCTAAAQQQLALLASFASAELPFGPR
ncbi:recombinase family protein [Brachybacterium hainanense]|uniref:Recombinase family protein n=1 Tax=Brachybacterium hainanense TaxID=1541174 RepID=A0ABV6RC51_9MICO